MKNCIRFTLLTSALAIGLLGLHNVSGAGNPAAAPPVLYRIQWLGSIGGTDTYARGMNASGQIVGTSVASGGRAAYLWTPSGGMVALESLVSGWVLFTAEDINEGGQIVGSGFSKTTGQSGGYIYTPGYTGSGGAWVPEHVEIIPPLPGNTVVSPAQINNHGEVCGESFGSTGGYHEVVYSPSTGTTDLGVTNGSDNLRSGINDNGRVVGTHIENGKYSTYVWDPVTGLRLYNLIPNSTGYFGSWGTAINNAGDFVGGCNNPKAKSTGLVPYKYPAGGSVKLLTTLGGKSFGINNNGQTVGDTYPDAFLHSDAIGFRNLDSLIVSTDPQRSTWLNAMSLHAEDICDAPNGGFGLICGDATFSDASGSITAHAYVLIPVAP